MTSSKHLFKVIIRYVGDASSLVKAQFQPWHIVMMVLLLSGVIAIAASTIVMPNAVQQHSISISSPIQTKASEALILSSPAPYPRKRESVPEAPVLTARAAIAVDVDSVVPLYSKNETMQLWPASTTKVMTSVVAIDLYSLEDVITVRNPLHEGVAGFVDQMNKKAQEIGLENTHYVDPAGFDNEKQFTTVSDLARLSTYALQYKTIEKMVGIPAITVPDTTFQHFHALHNVNQLLGSVPGVAGVKTGWTENAKENLINLTIRNGHRVLTVVLGSDDRFGETLMLTNWVYDSHEWNVLVTD